MENPSLRVSGHSSSMDRTFIVEECAKDEFGQWAKDGVTSEQGYIDDERSCFWTWDDNEYAWQSRPIKGRQVKRRKGAKEKVKVDSKGPEEHSSVKNEHRILNGGQNKTFLGGPEERKARKACRMAMMAFRRVVFALTSQLKAQARIVSRTKARESSKKEKARKSLILNREFQPQKHLKKKDIAMPGNQTTGLAANNGTRCVGLDESYVSAYD